MNESEIETLLTGLTPRGPSPTLRHQVQADLALDRHWLRPSGTRAALRRWAAPCLWAGVGAAAALALLALSPSTSREASMPMHSQTALLPVGTIREVLRTEDEGIRFNETSNTHEQRVRLYSVERQAWIDARDGARITVELPREDSLVLPVSYQ